MAGACEHCQAHITAGEFDWVHGIVVDSKGAVYAADTYGQRIQKFQK